MCGGKHKHAVRSWVKNSALCAVVLKFPKRTALAPEREPTPQAIRRDLLASARALNPGAVVVLYYREDLKVIISRRQRLQRCLTHHDSPENAAQQ